MIHLGRIEAVETIENEIFYKEDIYFVHLVEIDICINYAYV